HLTTVSVHQACVGLESGTVRYFPADDDRNRGSGSIIGPDGGGIERPCICLDDFMPNRRGPSLIKMDIEGAEWLAVQGARTALAQPGAQIDIVLEIHPLEIRRFGGTAKDLKTLLHDLGYSTAAVTPQGLLALDGSEETQRFWWASRNPTISK